MVSPTPPRHMFVDQVEFVAEHLRRGLMVAAQTGRISRQSMKKTLIETAGTMTHRAMCNLCEASRCSMPTACLHVAGTPCVDWSSMPGSSRSKECGNAALPFYAWAALQYLVQDLVIVHENVPSFDPSLLEYLNTCLAAYMLSASSSSILYNLAFLVGEDGGFQFSYTGNVSQTQSLLGQILLLHAAIGS